jgi:NADH pyrophosphatase NudC (nudix superfamily)
MQLDPHVAGMMVSTVGVAILMAISGVGKSALEWKHRRRLCPSCGRDLRSGCACH